MRIFFYEDSSIQGSGYHDTVERAYVTKYVRFYDSDQTP